NPRAEDMLNFNFANSYALARVIYTSSGTFPLGGAMIDDHPATSFQFSPSDPHPTAIVELGEAEQLQRVGVVYTMAVGRMDFYLLNELPVNPGDLAGIEPVASVADKLGGGKAAIDFEGRRARYIALRWTSAGSTHGEEPFAIAEIGAFGHVPLAFATLDFIPMDWVADNVVLAFPDPPVVVPV